MAADPNAEAEVESAGIPPASASNVSSIDQHPPASPLGGVGVHVRAMTARDPSSSLDNQSFCSEMSVGSAEGEGVVLPGGRSSEWRTNGSAGAGAAVWREVPLSDGGSGDKIGMGIGGGGDHQSLQSHGDASSASLPVVDIGRKHDKQLIWGRESHTSDLDEFDRYVARLRMVERRGDGPPGLGSGGGLGGGGHGIAYSAPEPAADDDEEEEDYDDEPDTEDEEGRGICEEFWQFVRSVLEKATPVGFTELPDPDSVVPKTKTDADAFLMKAVGIGIINPIHPAILARESGIPHEVAMEELLYATKVGLVSMRWAPECERCGSVVTESERIGSLPSRADCDGCHYPNDVNSMDRIKVIFNLCQDVLYVLMENYACTPSSESMGENALFAAVPATSTGSGFRYSVGCGEEELRPALSPGRYRMHCPVAKTDNYLHVEKDATAKDRPVKLKMRISDIVCGGGVPPDEKKELTVPHGKVHFDILPDTHSFFVLWVQNDKDDDTLMRLPDDERAPYTSATQMIHHRSFQRLFADQVVSSRPEALLKIKHVVLVFTDVVGSTNLYASLGDGPALQLVRRHYVVLFSAFTRRGRVVKTVGDAVMASFSSGRHAVEACAEALRKVPRACVLPDGKPLEIRIGVHCGSAVVVPLNGVNDYFGQTVNISARVEAAAKASECFITDAVLSSDPDAQSAYYEVLAGKNEAASGCKPGTFEATPETELNLKGVAEPVRARGLRLRRRMRRPSDAGMNPGAEPVRHYRRSDLYQRDDFDGLNSSDASLASLASSGVGPPPPGGLSRGSSVGSVGDSGEGNDDNDDDSGNDESPWRVNAKGVKGVSTRPAERGRRRRSLVDKLDEAEHEESIGELGEKLEGLSPAMPTGEN